MAFGNGRVLDLLQGRSRPMPTADMFETEPGAALIQCVEANVDNPMNFDLYDDHGTVSLEKVVGVLSTLKNEFMFLSVSESLAGQLMFKHAHTLLEDATRALERKEYAQAVKSSTRSLEIAEQLSHNRTQKAVVLICRAEAKYEMKDYKSAFNDVTKGIAFEARVMTGPLLLIKVFTAFGEYEKAFNLCITAIMKFEVKPGIFTQFVKRAVILAAKVCNGFQEIEILSESKINNDTWNDVVRELAKEDAWSFVKIILLGTDDNTGIEMTLNAKGIHLWGLIDYCDITPWKQWGQKLMLFLLKHGADYETICPKSKSPLHRAMEIGLKSDSFDLLKELLSNYVKPNKLNQIDENGNTLLHLACSDKSATRTTAIKFLLNHNLDIMLKNDVGEMAHELLPEEDEDRKMLQEIIYQKACNAIERTNQKQATSGNAGFTKLESKGIIDKKWSYTRVQNWLADCGLQHCQERLKQIEGSKLYELRILQDQCPDIFYRILEQDTQLGFVDILKLSAALRNCVPEPKLP
ncbi:hypothetical protein LSH36_8g00037 [Paralvinella palmiformis]|uniref:Ankyrin repeat protein n=1 Tax=Paralvinella palmiformis TaxID=53620 RepID=A0AAD9KE53_9ANNE|nr:hypothetical protein LSH36_8g00037 [Paralvinella palmiformis]